MRIGILSVEAVIVPLSCSYLTKFILAQAGGLMTPATFLAEVQAHEVDDELMSV
jgi:hypothetical protein